MQYKVVAALFFSTLALAAPAPQETGSSSSSSTSDSSLTNGEVDSEPNPYTDIPSSIEAVLATAIPQSWYDALTNPAAQSSIVAEIEAGTWPAWYNNLPASVKAWATSAGELGLSVATPTADSADSTTTAKAKAGSESASTGSGSTASAAVQTTAASTSSGSSSSAASSSSSSASAASSTSTGGAPVATGSVAMSLAGAAGLLGLVIAL